MMFSCYQVAWFFLETEYYGAMMKISLTLVQHI